MSNRLQILKQTPLYKGGKTLIDVGCITGSFEVKLASLYDKIIAFDPHQREINRAKEETKHLKNVEIYCSNFKNMNFKGIKADVVWMGNCLHYVFMEYNGFGFIPKLLSIATKYVIIEYPTDPYRNASDMRSLLASLKIRKLEKLYNRKNILKALTKDFKIEQMLESASKGREVLVLRRK